MAGSLARMLGNMTITNNCRRLVSLVSADELWKGVVGVSNAGKKKGRGKRVGRKKVTDLNKGQFIGEGKANMVWPGLNSPVIKGREVFDPEAAATRSKEERRDNKASRSDESHSLHGQPSSAPRLVWIKVSGSECWSTDPVGDYTFEGFDSRVLEFKLVTNMTGTLGRKMSFSALVITGNKNGLAGLGLGKAQSGRAAIRVAKNRAAQRLRFIPLYNNHTGFGLRCHRAIKTCCELIGIKDLHCKVEASTKNVNAITQAFFDALVNQETHSELADRMGYHVVEFRKERDNLPVVIASPTSGVVREDELRDEEEDLEVEFDRLYYGGKCELQRPPRQWFYSKFRSWKKKKAELHAVRNQPDAQILRRAGLW